MMRFTDMDLRLPGWGLFGGAARSQPSKHLRGKPGGPLSADVSFETVDGIELRVARWRLDAPCAHPRCCSSTGSARTSKRSLPWRKR